MQRLKVQLSSVHSLSSLRGSGFGSKKVALLAAAALSLLAGCAGVGSASSASGAGGKSAAAKSEGPQAAPGLTEAGPGVERFYRIRTPGAPTIMPDGSLLVRDLPEGVSQVYRIPAGADGKAVAVAKPKELVGSVKMTNFKDGATGYTVSPDYKRVMVMTAAGGNERNQVYLLDTSNTNPETNLTPVLVNPEVVFRPNGWTKDSSGFYYSANDTDANNFHLSRYDFASKSSTKLLAREGDWSVADSSVDGSRVLVTQYRSSSDSDVSVLDVKSGALTLLNPALVPAGTTASLEPVGFARDEKSVFVISDHEEGIKRLFQVDLATMKATKPLAQFDTYELDSAGISEKRTLMAVAVNENGYGVPHVFRLPGFTKLELPAMERGVVSLTELEDNRIGWSLANARTPGLAYSWNIPEAGKPAAQPAGAVRQVSFADSQDVDFSQFALPELVKVRSFDGMEIPAFLYLPSGAKKGTPVPFVVDYHGGPEGQYRPDYSNFVQYLLSEGFGVLRPNVRGSSGYGRAFIMADDYKLRWGAVRDGWHCAQWLVQNGYATPGKIASYGGSYGGFMTTAVQVEDSNRLEAGDIKQRLFGASINVVGVINFKTFLERTSGYRRKLREVEYGPLSDPEFLNSVSPLLQADKINVPMLLAHGANDPRVPVTEAMQMAEALMRRGWDPEQIYFDDEGHGFAKLENRLLFAKRMSRFLKQHIGK
jgi:dipeptidyl aminopeptidase/acylaminoacyl peptidase